MAIPSIRRNSSTDDSTRLIYVTRTDKFAPMHTELRIFPKEWRYNSSPLTAHVCSRWWVVFLPVVLYCVYCFQVL
jgi:hypothetical protein